MSKSQAVGLSAIPKQACFVKRADGHLTTTKNNGIPYSL